MSAAPSFNPGCPRCSFGHGIANTVGFTRALVAGSRTVAPQCQDVWTETDQVRRLLGLNPPIPRIAPRGPGSRATGELTQTRAKAPSNHWEISDHSPVSMSKK